jgi:uncharacterized protein (DUF2062 family)
MRRRAVQPLRAWEYVVFLAAWAGAIVLAILGAWVPLLVVGILSVGLFACFFARSWKRVRSERSEQRQ